MRVKATIFSPPGCFLASWYVPYMMRFCGARSAGSAAKDGRQAAVSGAGWCGGMKLCLSIAPG